MIESDILTNLSRYIEKSPYEILVDGQFSCPTKWRRQHDHRKLLANDVTVSSCVSVITSEARRQDCSTSAPHLPPHRRRRSATRISRRLERHRRQVGYETAASAAQNDGQY